MVTIKDVAKTAGVSVKTVSRVLTGNGYASAKTRAQVERAAKKLGYVPNRIASGLATGRTQSIGMVVPDIASVHFAEIALGAQTAAMKLGYHLILANTTGSLDEERHVLRFLHQTRVDGVILAGARLPDSDLLPALAQYPAFVSINHPVPSDLGASVTSEHAKGIAQAVEHLLHSQRKVIAFMAGPSNSYTADERMRGFLQAMKNFDRPINRTLIVPYETNYAEGFHSQYEWFSSADVGSVRWSELRATFGARGACVLLTVHPQVDGIVCFDDQTAFGVLRACAQLGRRVPDDIAVIGCNDIPLAVQATPTLTTQRIPRYQIGKRAVELLIEGINGNRHQSPVVFPHELIFRESAPAVIAKEKSAA